MRWMAALALGMTAGAATAGGFGPAVTSGTYLVPGGDASRPTPLEWLRLERPRIGRDAIVPTADGRSIATIEWRRPVEVRVRTESGAPLTPAERQAILSLAPICDRGEVRNLADLLERNGTYVVEYDCVWLQGLEPA